MIRSISLFASGLIASYVPALFSSIPADAIDSVIAFLRSLDIDGNGYFLAIVFVFIPAMLILFWISRWLGFTL